MQKNDFCIPLKYVNTGNKYCTCGRKMELQRLKIEQSKDKNTTDWEVTLQ